MQPNNFLALTLTVVLTLLLPVAQSSAQIAEAPFDVLRMNDAEARAVQSALALTGDYIGLVDGVWGPRSASAIDSFARQQGHFGPARMRDVGELMWAFLQRLSNEQWRMTYLDSVDYSIAIPLGILRLLPSGIPSETRAPDDSLSLDLAITDARTASGFHQSALAQSALGTQPEHFVYLDLALTSVDQAGSGRIYVRTVRGGGGSLTFQVESAPHRNDVLALMAATLVEGRAPPLVIPNNGVLAAAMETVQPPRPEPVPQNGGTAFHVNPETLVTAFHLVADCTRIALSDETPLTLLAADHLFDLAVVRTPRPARSRGIIINRVVETRLGQRVHALGYPFQDTLERGLALSRVEIVVLANAASTWQRMSLSHPLQPGSGGGPVLSDDGTLLGVLTAEPGGSDTNAQRIDYATSSDALVALLDALGVAIAEAPNWRLYMQEGIPPDLAEAVVSIICH
jgi:serine protease Do